MKKLSIVFIFLFLMLTACSTNTPQAVSTQSPVVQSGKPSDTPEPAAPDPGVSPTPSSEDSSALPMETPLSEKAALPIVGFPDAAGYSWKPILDGLDKPIDLTSARDGSGRLFILEQEGIVIVVEDGVRRQEPFLDIRDRVGADGSERGLLGIAFHPGYPENGFFYVNYTDKSGNTVIARFQVSSQDANQADPSSEQRLLQVEQPYANHNGGGVAFGPDGYLYIALGDGGSGGDPMDNAQSTNTLLGKILRINVDATGQDEAHYGIPGDNPFSSGGGLPEIWAYGLRNPWRFSFDHLTGDLYIGDVGQNKWEEINYLPVGSPGGINFGWNFMEGTHSFEGTAPGGLTNPVFEYDHSQGCSVTGGVVYRGQQIPEWNGIYFLGDYCSGNIWGLFRNSQGDWESKLLFNGVGNITSFGLDETGEVYLVIHNGSLLKLSRNAP